LNTKYYAGIMTCCLIFATDVTNANVVDDLLNSYSQDGAKEFNATIASEQWTKKIPNVKTGKPRSCSTCHTKNLRNTGKHVKTGKRIKPLAPSENAERLTDAKHIEKWFRRNCKWTLGRECTPQEKGNFLLFIQNQ